MSSRNRRRELPEFASEDKEREFWADHDVVDHFDFGNAVSPSFPKLKPSTKTISVRLPTAMLDDLKPLANERGVPYQSLLKVSLAERIARERETRRRVRA